MRGLHRGLIGSLAEGRTGERVWAFRATAAGAQIRPVPAAANELDGRQFVAIPMGRDVWAFTLDGPVAARGEVPADPWAPWAVGEIRVEP